MFIAEEYFSWFLLADLASMNVRVLIIDVLCPVRPILYHRDFQPGLHVTIVVDDRSIVYF